MVAFASPFGMGSGSMCVNCAAQVCTAGQGVPVCQCACRSSRIFSAINRDVRSRFLQDAETKAVILSRCLRDQFYADSIHFPSGEVSYFGIDPLSQRGSHSLDDRGTGGHGFNTAVISART